MSAAALAARGRGIRPAINIAAEELAVNQVDTLAEFESLWDFLTQRKQTRIPHPPWSGLCC
jgi:hypothetical protein